MSTGSAGCGDATHPRDEVIKNTYDALWEAAGVAGDDVNTSPYVKDSKRDIVGCADLPDEDDRWVAYRTAQVAGEKYPQSRLFDSVSEHLGDEGFEVARYRDPVSDYLQLRGEKDEVVVFFNVESNGATNARVIAGPCATFMGRDAPENAEPID